MKFSLAILMLCAAITSHAQDKLKIKVSDAKTHEPLELVIISSNNNWLGSTDDAGTATVTLPHGPNKLHISLTGYESSDTTIQANGAGELSIFLESTDNDLEEVTVLASTRNNESIENSPSKVEVLGLEEMKEEAAIKPGNIGSILGDVSGVQVQQSSATSGNSNVRIQGLGGKYTQILRDGMPLYDGFSGGFGIMTIPPLDLKQIELIKGSASTLYGGGAIGGLINLISKRPTFKQELDALVNYTSLKEGNVNV
ncbi:MAG: TonB-dependent receptor, partial [Flavipsychrobacter sp.]